MKVLFTHSYFLHFDPKQLAKKQPYPPLATIQAAAVLRDNGFDVRLFDVNFETEALAIEQTINAFEPELLVIYDDGFNYLTKMCLTKMREAAFEMIKLAKARGIPVAVSSSDSTDQFEMYLDVGADYILLGEAEETLLELASAHQKQKGTSAIQGLVLREEGKTINTGRRPIMRDLDQLPLPAWDLIEMDRYRQVWNEGNGFFSLNIATTRGCPYKCNWCAKPIYGQKYNARSPEHVVDEIELLVTKYQPTHFWVCDDIFGLKPGWVQKFDQLIKERGLEFRYTIQSRVDLMLKEDQIDALASSGAHEIWVGAESGSQKILDAMDKGTTVEQIREATQLLKKKGIKVAFFLQFGYPGETRSDIQKTIDMVLELMPDNIGVSVSYPLPGTPFYDRVKSELVSKANWEDSDDLDLMFSGPFSKAYYRKLQRYIHRMLRLKQGRQARSLRAIILYPYYLMMTFFDKQTLAKLEKEAHASV